MRSPLSLLSSLYFQGFGRRLRDSFLSVVDKKEIVANVQGCNNPLLIDVWTHSSSEIDAWALEAAVTVDPSFAPPPIIAIQTPESSPRTSPEPEPQSQPINHIPAVISSQEFGTLQSPTTSVETSPQPINHIPSAICEGESATPSHQMELVPSSETAQPLAPPQRPCSPKRRNLSRTTTKSTTEKLRPRPRTPSSESSQTSNSPSKIKKKPISPKPTNVKKVNRPLTPSATAQKFSAILSAVDALPLDRKPFPTASSNQQSPCRDVLAAGVLSYKFASTPAHYAEYKEVQQLGIAEKRKSRSRSSTPRSRSRSASPSPSLLFGKPGRVSKDSMKNDGPKTPLKLRVNELHRRASLPHCNPMTYLGLSSGFGRGGAGYVDILKAWKAEEDNWEVIR